jgi:hypothetical protein
MNAELLGKRWGLLHDLVPKAATIAMLFDPSQQNGGPVTLPDARNAAATLGQKLLVLGASPAEEIDAQFARLDQEPADAMLVTVSLFFVTRPGQIAALAARHALPAAFPNREYALAGGLMSYGGSIGYFTTKLVSIPAASSKARNQPISRCSRRRNSNSSSTSRPPRRSASPSQKRYWPLQTRSYNEQLSCCRREIAD